MRLLSIDSGIERTGFAVLNKEKSEFKLLTSGLIKTSKSLSLEDRLIQIYDEVKSIINKFKPEIIILEQIFFFKNQKTIVKVAQAQGVVLLLAAQQKLQTAFLTPLQIKQTITGYGMADKKSIRKMLQLTLKDVILSNQDDELDAIACGLAYCYLNRA